MFREILEKILGALIAMLKLLGYSKLQDTGTICLLPAALYSALFYSGYDIKLRPRLGLVKYHQKWSLRALALSAASFILKIALEFSRLTVTLVPGLLAFKASLLLEGVLPALFGIPAAYGMGLGAAVSDVISNGFSVKSASYLYWGVASYYILFRFYGEDPSLGNLKSLMSYTLGWWSWSIGTSVIWTTIAVLEGSLPLEVAWSAYIGIVLLAMLALYVINMALLPPSYFIAKRVGVYWREIPGYYAYEYVFPKFETETAKI